jgi:hypothetical protein
MASRAARVEGAHSQVGMISVDDQPREREAPQIGVCQGAMSVCSVQTV